MEFLNRAHLEAVSAAAFRAQQPYPWTILAQALTEEGHEKLLKTLPDVALFERKVGYKRGYGQAPHDRFVLHYRPSLPLAEPWREFITELNGVQYMAFLRRMLGDRRFLLTMEWHYAWQGCSISPHCDARRKLATQLFYFNTAEDWDPQWGGETLVLDSGGRFKTHSAPDLDDFKVVAAAPPMGNGSLFFMRTPHSWHAVRPLTSPPGKLRKVFHVTINVANWQVLWRKVRGKDPDGYSVAA